MIKIVTSFPILCRLARNLYEAECQGNQEEIDAARIEHDAYRDLCLEADEMLIGYNVGELE